MQKFEERNTYTPTNIPHVCSNCDLLLNGEETPCVAGLKTSLNNSDAALTGFRLFQNGTRIEFPLQKQPSILQEENDTQLSLKLELFIHRKIMNEFLENKIKEKDHEIKTIEETIKSIQERLAEEFHTYSQLTSKRDAFQEALNEYNRREAERTRPI